MPLKLRLDGSYTFLADFAYWEDTNGHDGEVHLAPPGPYDLVTKSCYTTITLARNITAEAYIPFGYLLFALHARSSQRHICSCSWSVAGLRRMIVS